MIIILNKVKIMRKIQMSKCLLLTFFIGALHSCSEKPPKPNFIYGGNSDLSMSVKPSDSSVESKLEADNIVNNMHILLFTDASSTSVLRQNVGNLERNIETNTVTSAHVLVGDWCMRAFSSIDPIKFENTHIGMGITKESLLYKFTPETPTSLAPQVVLLSENVSVTKVATEVVVSKFKRAVGRVELAIVDIQGDIKLNSENHTVEIMGVPTSLSIEGGLLRDGVHNRANPDTLVRSEHKLVQPITIHSVVPKPASSTLSDYDYYPKAKFIIPAYDDNASPVTADPHADNKKLRVRISLETNNGTFYEHEVVIDKALSANKGLYLKLHVKGAFEIVSECIDWTIWVSNPEL